MLLVYDVKEMDTITDLKVWITTIWEHAPENIKMILVGNKVDDFERREVTRFDLKLELVGR